MQEHEQTHDREEISHDGVSGSGSPLSRRGVEEEEEAASHGTVGGGSPGTLLAPPYNPYALTTTVGGTEEVNEGFGGLHDTTMNGTTDVLLREEEEEEEEEVEEVEEDKESSLSARSEMEVLEKHVQSLLNPNDRRDMALRIVGCLVLTILLITLIVQVTTLTTTNENIRTQGPRVTIPTPTCPTPIPPLTAASWDPKTTTLLPGMGVTTLPPTTIPLSPFIASSLGIVDAIKATAELPPHPSKNIVLLSSDPARYQIGLAVLSEGSQGVEYRYTLPLVHTEVLDLTAHGVQQHSGEWDLCITYKQNLTLLATTVSIRIDGNVNMNTAVELASYYPSTFAKGTYLQGLPLRYVVVVEGYGSVCEYNVLEAATSYVARLFTRVSGHAMCGGSMSVAGMGPATFFIAANNIILLVEITSKTVTEWDGASVPCNHPLITPYTEDKAALICADGLLYLATIEDGKGLAMLSIFAAAPQAGYTPLGWYLTDADETLVLGKFHSDTSYTLYKILLRDGGLYPSDMVRLPFHTTQPVLGLFASTLTLLSPVTNEVNLHTLSWKGGYKTAGITLSPCTASMSTVLLVQGVVDFPSDSKLIPGHGVRLTTAGAVTTGTDSAAYKTIGRSLSPTTVYIDLLRDF